MSSSPHPSQAADRKESRALIGIRVILIVATLLLCGIQLFVTFRGLGHASVMDQAQIARNLAQGNGMTTSCLFPLDLVKADAQAEREIRFSDNPEATPQVDIQHFPSLHHAPLNICAMAVALRLTGYHDYYARRQELAESGRLGHLIYPGDRVIAATSTIFFIVAMVLGYTLIMRLFDEVVAASAAALMLCNEAILGYATSGLPQPLMACFLLLALHFLLSAIRHREDEIPAPGSRRRRLMGNDARMAMAFICLGLMALTGWGAAWCAVGLALFCLAYFRRGIAYAVGGLAIVGLMCAVIAYGQCQLYGGMLQYYFFCAADCLGADGVAAALRSGLDSASPINGTDFIVRWFGYAFGQFGSVVSVMGGIFVCALFFLALFHRYKRAEMEGFKWAIVLMWFFCSLGMALTGGATTFTATQLSVLFLPIFLAYGLSLIYNFVIRSGITDDINRARSFAFFLLFIICSVPFLFELYHSASRALRLGEIGLAQYPPYCPPALYGRMNANTPGFVELTAPDDVIVTDQPWGAAWYGHRKSIWLPQSVEAYDNLSRIVSNAGLRVGGILITPCSTVTPRNGMQGILRESGEFAPLAMEGSVLLADPNHRIRLTDLFINNKGRDEKGDAVGNLVSSRGTFSGLHLLLGANYILYTRPQ